MSFANRAELIAAGVDWLNRIGSGQIAVRFPDFITLHEARANRELRVRQMVKRATATLSDGMIRLPSDWLEAKQIQINVANGKPRRLQPMTMEQADDIRAEGVLTDPTYFCIVGDYLEVVPYTTAALEIEMAFYASIPALTEDASTNWLLVASPDYYLYGALAHSAPYLRDDERVALWAAAAAAAKAEMDLADERAAHSGGRLKTRARLRN